MSSDASPEISTRNPKNLYTVGHSNWEYPLFIRLVKKCDVELLIDVRSRPHSSRYPQFSQPGFEGQLRSDGIAYLFLGEELGGRPDDPDAYRSNGVVDYRARRNSYAFRAGVERLMAELEKHCVALMCAEEDPLECHRFLMICPELVALDVRPLHIRKGTQPETQEAAENRLLSSNGFDAVAHDSQFSAARAEVLEEAYSLQAEKAAFRVEPNLRVTLAPQA